MSAPTSPVCSPSPSYHRISPAIFRARSEPRNRNTGLSCSYQIPLDKISGDPPLESRTVSSYSHVQSAPLEPSKISLEWRESFCHANVHTLPLPPLSSTSSTSHLSGATNSLSPAPISSLVLRSENSGAKQSSPVRSQWQKGKLIGRGTFGSVYVGSNRYAMLNMLADFRINYKFLNNFLSFFLLCQ